MKNIQTIAQTQITPRHAQVTRLLHWLTPLLLAYGYIRNGEVTGALQNPAAMNREIWFGALVFGIFLLRFIWVRLFNHGASRLAPTAPGWERKLSKLGHISLYAGVAGIIVTGWSIALAQSTGNPLVVEAAVGIHVFLTSLMLVLIGGHVLAALWHFLWRKDGVWESMGTPTFQFLRHRIGWSKTYMYPIIFGKKLAAFAPFAKWKAMR